VRTGSDAKVKDALDHVRAAAQELHAAISDAVAKHGGATKAHLEVLVPKAKAVTESAKGSIGAQQEVVTQLAATQKHLAEGLKASGHAFQTSIRQALANARGFRPEGQRSRCGKAFGCSHENITPQMEAEDLAREAVQMVLRDWDWMTWNGLLADNIVPALDLGAVGID